MIKYTTHEVSSHVLTTEAAECVLHGSHEARVWAALPMKGEGKPVTAAELKKRVGDETAKVGQGRAFKSGWIGKEGDGFVKLVRFVRLRCMLMMDSVNLTMCQVTEIQDTTQLDLREVDSTGSLKAGEKTLADLRKRKLIVQR